MDKTKLEMRKISIEFPGVKALTDVDFDMECGKIHALVGANGAGKSTLMKILAGANTHYTGQISINGKPVEIRSPRDAKNQSIEIVYQEVDTALIPYLTVAENVMFSSMVNKMGKKQVVDWKDVRKRAKETLKLLNVDLNVNRLVSSLTLAEKQMVLIARCVVEKAKFLILDEPTAPLSGTETQELFRVVRDLAADGVGVVFITHRLAELYEICTTITIMKDGRVVTNLPLNDELSINQIVEYMLGRKFDETYPKKEVPIGDVLLKVEHLSDRKNEVEDVSLEVRKGEIVAIAGLVGAGKTELCKTLFGAMKIASGTISLDGKLLRITSPTTAVRQGLALVPEERRKEGVLITDPVYSNITIASLAKYTGAFSVVNKKAEKADARRMIQDLGIKTPSENQKVALLSGGNQQKVAVAKWLNSDSDIYIFDEPTKGVDVGAKRDIFQLIEGLVQQGKGIIYASCEFDEILAIADRIYVMYDSKIAVELSRDEADEQKLLYYSTGGN